ncbi:YesL family protein [Bacillus sp. AK128]
MRSSYLNSTKESGVNMEQHKNTFNHILTVFSYFFLLNVMWFLLCLPVVTAFPATTAMYGTVRKWIREGFDVGIFHVFFQQFKENFKKSFIIGLFWLFAVVILYLDLFIVFQNEFTGRSLLVALLFFFGIIVAFTTVYVFFVLVHYELTIFHTLKNSLFLSISHMNFTILFIGMILLTLVIVYYFPFFLLIGGSLLAFTMYGIFHRLTKKLEELRNR